MSKESGVIEINLTCPGCGSRTHHLIKPGQVIREEVQPTVSKLYLKSNCVTCDGISGDKIKCLPEVIIKN